MGCDVTCVITAHQEGRLVVPTLVSFDAATREAEATGVRIERMFCLDRPDTLTESLFRAFAHGNDKVIVFDHGDQGLVRNESVIAASGKKIAFLDADDLWQRTWLVRALSFLDGLPDETVAHPAYNYFFEGQATIFCHVDQLEAGFELDLLRLMNYWDALAVCATDIYRRFPFPSRAINEGWAYEDWQWNCETIAAGVTHRVVPSTVIFKRRRDSSQTMKAFRNHSRMRRGPLHKFDNSIYSGSVKTDFRT